MALPNTHKPAQKPACRPARRPPDCLIASGLATALASPALYSCEIAEQSFSRPLSFRMDAQNEIKRTLKQPARAWLSAAHAPRTAQWTTPRRMWRAGRR